MMKESQKTKKHDRNKQVCNFYYSEELQANVIKVINSEMMYPCYWQDPEAGMREIRKTKNNRLCMR